MKTITNIFLKGLLLLLPGFITFALVFWLISTAESLLRTPLQWVLPEGWYFAGMGLIVTLGIIFLLGLLVQGYLANRIFTWFEDLLSRIPLVKTLYSSAKDFMNFVAGGGKDQAMQRVVRVTMDNNIHVIGFVTQESITLGAEADLMAVYVPMSYMIGGFLLYVPRSRIEPLDIPVQQAMQQVITAHIAGNHR